MKNNFLLIIFFFFIFNSLLAENVSIESKTITLYKNKDISIFENQVKIITEENNKLFFNLLLSLAANTLCQFPWWKRFVAATAIKNVRPAV